MPTDGSNLAVRAALALAERTGVRPAVRLHLRKGIPVAGGMAGGSADAAAALVACDALWGTGLSRDELVELAAGLGADVPFALVGGTAVGAGTGTRLTAGAGPGALPLGLRARRRAGCRRPTSTPSSTGSRWARSARSPGCRTS